MDYFDSHLPVKEKVVARTRKSAVIFFRDFLVALVLGGIATGLYFALKRDLGTLRWICVGAAGIEMLFLADSYIRIVSTSLVVTTHKFMTKEALVAIKITETLLDNIDNVEVEYKDAVRRMMNVGDIVVRTRSTEIEYTNIARPDVFAAVLNGQVARMKERQAGTVRIAFGVKGGQGSPAGKGTAPAAAKAAKGPSGRKTA